MLRVISLQEEEKWDTIVSSFAMHDIYWKSGYVKAFKIHGDGEPLLFYYEDDCTRGINVVMKRDVAEDEHFIGRLPQNKYFDFACPYGYGGWLIEGKNPDMLFETYEKWCANNGIISEFVRFHPVLENHYFCQDAYDVIPLGNTIVLDLSTPEVIWANFTSKNRNMIRKAQKNNVKVYSGRDPQIFDTFKRIYDKTMDKDNAESYYYFEPEFYESILYDLPYNAQVFYAVCEGKVIASSIMLFDNGRMNYHLSGSVKEYSNLAPSNLLLYNAALWGCANGYKSLYLGGGVGSGEDNLFKFKKSFYRLDDLKRFYIGKKIFLNEKYNELIMMREDNDSNFFPKYRA